MHWPITRPFSTSSAAQRRRAVPLVVVCHRPAAALLHRQSRLGAIERLDLRLLIDREHQCVLGRIDIEAHDILHLGGKLRIVRQLEGAHPVRLEAMRRPDALHAAMADPGGFRHRPAGPVRHLSWRFGERHFNHAFDRRRRQWRLAARARRVVE
jgi:hypothetical protein